VLFISPIHSHNQKETTTHPFKDKWWFGFIIVIFSVLLKIRKGVALRKMNVPFKIKEK